MVKIGPMDLEIINLQEIIKCKKEINGSRTYSTRGIHAARAK